MWLLERRYPEGWKKKWHCSQRSCESQDICVQLVVLTLLFCVPWKNDSFLVRHCPAWKMEMFSLPCGAKSTRVGSKLSCYTDSKYWKNAINRQSIQNVTKHRRHWRMWPEEFPILFTVHLFCAGFGINAFSFLHVFWNDCVLRDCQPAEHPHSEQLFNGCQIERGAWMILQDPNHYFPSLPVFPYVGCLAMIVSLPNCASVLSL